MPRAADPRPGVHSLLRKALAFAAFLFVLALLGGVALRGHRLVREEAEGGRTGRYNVLLITVDTLRADRLGCYGNAAAATPAIDRLAADGILFERAETAAPITLPAHASILTGTYPAFHGARNNGTYRVGPRAVTLAEVFHAHRYRTRAVISGYPLAARFGLSQGFDYYDDRLPAEKARQVGYRERKAEEVTRAGLTWISHVAEQRFFLWLHYFDPHAPYSPPSPYAERFSRAPYDGEVAYVDREVGKVLDELRRKGLAEKTLVVLVADHGEALGDHGEQTHGVFLYESTLRVPMILSLPGVLPRGKRVANPVRTVDLMPTILRLADLPEPDDVQGTSLLPLTSRRGADLLLKSMSETFLPRENYGWSELASLRIGDWKFILAPQEELYDLRTDPGEKNNLARRRQGDLAGFREELHRLMSDAAPVGGPIAYRQELDETAIDRLRSLGYLWAPGPARGESLPDPKDRIGLLGILDDAASLYAKGDFASAIQKYGELLQSDPGNLTALLHRGNARVEARDFTGAAADFEAVLFQRPRSPEVLLNLGSALMGQGLLNEAARTFRQVIDLDPDSDKALTSLGLALARQGHSAEAAAMFRKALALNRASSEARQGLATALAAGGKREEAEAAFLKAVEEAPSDPAPALALARILYDAGRYDAIIALLEKSLRAGADGPEVHYALGNAHFRKGEILQASEEYARVLSVRPDDPGALLGSALVALKSDRRAEAIRLLERSRASDPSNGAVHRNLAILYDEDGRDRAAINEYRATLVADPSAREIHFHLGRLYARLGQPREAKAEYEAYLTGGGGDFAAEAKKEISRLPGS
ncbi:MAG TPA: sulfatase-like hydrolase/transferase [Candidatus Polarisedimenticolia bacterium]|nr:sulfatase-like hydrolase/transferase [Candidatus Polarisedimenticolia bacterium]